MHPFRIMRTLLAALATATAVLAGGCYDMEIRQTLRGDGNLAIGVDLRFDPDMEDVFSFFEAVAKALPETPPGLLTGGLCGMAERFAGLSPGAMPDGYTLSGRQFQDNGRFVCQTEAGVGPASAAFAALQANPAMLVSPYRVKSEGPRRYRVTLDLASIPDPDDLIRMGVVAMIMDPNRRPGGAPARMPPPEQLDEIAQSYKKASLASARMFGRERRLSFVLAAPRIVESNGEIAPDRRTVRFSYTWLDLTAVLFDADRRRQTVHWAVVEH